MMEFAFANAGDKEKIITFKQWGDINISAENFYDCSNMEITAIDKPNSGDITIFADTWHDCTSLTDFPWIDTSSGIDFSSAWNNCDGLTSFPLLNMSSGTIFHDAWLECSGLTSFPLLDVSAGLDFDDAWRLCTGLVDFPLLDMSSGTMFSQSWRDCSSLANFPLLDMNAGTNFTNAWLNCALDSDSIDNIMQALVNNGSSGLSTSLAGGTSLSGELWSEAASANYCLLIDDGWTIDTNGVVSCAPEILNANLADLSPNNNFSGTLPNLGNDTNDFSIVVNFKIISYPDSFFHVMAIDTGNENDYWVGIAVANNNTVIGTTYKQSGAGDTIITSPTSLGQWYHAVFTYNGANKETNLYVDNVLIGSNTSEGGWPGLSRMVQGRSAAGRDAGSGINYSDCEIHSPMVFNRLLTSQERSDIWNSGTSKCYDLLTANTPSLADSVYAPPLYNHAGFVGQELIDQSTSGVVTTNNNSTPFTGSAQIECTS